MHTLVIDYFGGRFRYLLGLLLVTFIRPKKIGFLSYHVAAQL